MARRASSSPPLLYVLLAVALLAAVLGGAWMVFGKLGDPLRTVTALPVSDYLENANALRGNTYKLEATVAKSLEWSAQGGRLFAVDAAGEVLPLLVPPQLQSVNIERGQRLHFRLEVGEGGLLKVLEVRKA